MARRRANTDNRSGATNPLAAYLGVERSRLTANASPLRQEQLRAAERQRAVFRAWNEVCAGTREGAHVTGLFYVPERNELVVYLDAASWTQEFTMLREIVRARMALAGVSVDRLSFRTSRDGHAAARPAAPRKTVTAPASKPRPPRRPLTPAESARIAAAVDGIGDPRLKEALRNAMRASFEWKKGLDVKNEP